MINIRKTYLAFLAPILTSLFSALCSCSSEGGNAEVEYLPVQLTDGGAWGFIDSEGKRVGSQSWEFEPTVTRCGVFVARTDSGLTVYRWNGDEARPVDSLQNLASAGVYNEGLISVAPFMRRITVYDRDGDKKFVIDPINGKEVTSCGLMFKDGLLTVTTEDGKTGVIDRKGDIVVEPKYDEISEFNDGYAMAVIIPKEDFDKGPSYYIIGKDGKETKVGGKFGYSESECEQISAFDHGFVYVAAPYDTIKNETGMLRISTDGSVTAIKDWSYPSYLDNGAYALTAYDPGSEKSTSTWYSADGKILRKSDDYTYTAYGRFMVASKYSPEGSVYVAFNENGDELAKLNGDYFFSSPGGKFSLVVSKTGEYGVETASLYDSQCKPVLNSTYPNIGTATVVSLSDSDEEICGTTSVTSAYVDITAASTKFASMIKNGSVKGKEVYYIGQSIASMLAGENARFYTGQDRSVSIPTAGETYNLGSGAGFWIDGTAESSARVVAPTYAKYFDVAYYDYRGTAWGHWRQRQTGIKFNPAATIEGFNLKMRTNHSSGGKLRENVGRHLKTAGYVLVNSTDTYDEYQNGDQAIVIYGTKDSHGIGAIVKSVKALSKLSASQKAALAASL